MTVVVGYVPTETGFSAVTEAQRQAQWRNVPVVIVNVVGAAGYRVATAADQRNLDAVAADLTAHGVANSVRHVNDAGPPADVILRVAHEVGASLIVLGLHHRAWIVKRVIGSTAQSIVLDAPCPVLVVPDIDEHSKPRLPVEVEEPPLPSMGQTPRRDT